MTHRIHRRDHPGSRRMGIGPRMVLLVAGTLVLVLGATAALVIHRTHVLVDAQCETAARMLAGSVADAIQAFGEVGEMDGLGEFLGNLETRGELGAVHAIRGRATVADYGEREGAAASGALEQQVLQNGDAAELADADAHARTYVLPLLTDESCISCHPSAKPGDVLGAASVTVRTDAVDAAQTSLARTTGLIFLFGIALTACVLAIAMSRSVIRPITKITAELWRGSAHLAGASEQANNSTSTLASDASQQASSLEETSATLEEMAAMTRTNAANSQQANQLVTRVREGADQSNQELTRLNDAMTGINASSEQISKIIKVIEEIAFQTNLLALNAAVEAARAGEHGQGFAVVANEVRNLAQRAADAARETTGLIEESVSRAREGVEVAGGFGQALAAIVKDVSETSGLVNGIKQGSQEQAQGIEQVNIAVSQMDKVTQSIAACSEESAAAVERLRVEAESVARRAHQLADLIGIRVDRAVGGSTNEPALESPQG